MYFTIQGRICQYEISDFSIICFIKSKNIRTYDKKGRQDTGQYQPLTAL